MEVAEEIAITAATGHDYSVWGLLMQADPVVKGVIVLLVIASVACWAITFEKIVRISWLKSGIRRLAKARSSSGRRGLSGAVLAAGEAELAADLDDSPTERRFRVENAMRHEFKSQIQNVEGGLPFLATTGSAAPFIGLFGTVWGIVNSFTAIAQQKDTSSCGRGPRHRRSPDCHGDRSCCGHSRGGRLQPNLCRARTRLCARQ